MTKNVSRKDAKNAKKFFAVFASWRAVSVLLALSALLATRFGARAADPPSVRSMTMVVGKGELLRFDLDVARVVIAEPKIADAIVVSPRDVMVNAKGAGHTTLVIWEDGQTPVRYDITVAGDATDLDTLHSSLAAELKSALPDTAIDFSGNAETIVLTGKVSDPEQSKRANAL